MPRDHRVMQFVALTPRERRLLELAANGLDNYEIEEELTLARGSAGHMFAQIYRKLDIKASPRKQRDEAIRQFWTGEALG